ncbi:MAG: DUF3024 domain-containing protein [Pseudomonadota bacterium]
MAVTTQRKTTPHPLANAHPNDVDRKRIERALANRKRYRYVEPLVLATPGGYRITSPCCSRNIDPSGGMIDIALMLYMSSQGVWSLYRMNHPERQWVLHSELARLNELLAQINEDQDRIFWR